MTGRKRTLATGGRARARRTRTGKHKRLAVRLSEKEKARIERAAARAGLSMGRFIVERALKEADRVLSKMR